MWVHEIQDAWFFLNGNAFRMFLFFKDDKEHDVRRGVESSQVEPKKPVYRAIKSASGRMAPPKRSQESSSPVERPSKKSKMSLDDVVDPDNTDFVFVRRYTFIFQVL